MTVVSMSVDIYLFLYLLLSFPHWTVNSPGAGACSLLCPQTLEQHRPVELSTLAEVLYICAVQPSSF